MSAQVIPQALFGLRLLRTLALGAFQQCCALSPGPSPTRGRGERSVMAGHRHSHCCDGESQYRTQGENPAPGHCSP